VTIDVFGRWIGGRVTAEPLYDPASARVKGVQTGAAPAPTMG
jgi:4-methylaminobutanoate oxidase (formaldehyde-forming)